MIEIRRLTELDQFTEAVHLQQEIWGFLDIELLPARLFVVANKIGGHLFGGYDGDRMIAFLVAIPGLKEASRGYLHSHMMGVLPEYRNRGLARSLKMAQKADALKRGIALIEWTFDPLELKNAYFNIEKLGAIMRRYLFNNYGTTSSRLHAGLPTDRLVAEWWVEEPRRLAPAVEARIAIPADIADLRVADPAAAREIQLRASEQFTEHFMKGLAVVGFERSDDAGTYLLGPWHPHSQ